MKIEKDKIVELKYELHADGKTGDLLEVMDEHWPLKFYFGAGVMLPKFEEELHLLEEGDAFEFMLRPVEAYGELDPSRIREIPFSELPDRDFFPNRDLEKGDRLVFNMGENEEQLGTISEVMENSVLIDFNHALAGKSLHFSGRVLYVREPRQEEREVKRYIEPNGIRSDSRLGDGFDS